MRRDTIINDMGIESSTNEAIFTPINGASAAMGFLLAGFIFLTQLLKLPSASRLSFRLYLWIGLADVGTHLPLHLNFSHDIRECHITNLVVSYSNFVSLLIVGIMAMNLHLVFILQKPAAVRSIRVYLGGVFFVALLLMIPSVTLVLIYPDFCPFFTAFGFPHSLVILLATQGLPQIILIVYCLYVFTQTTLQLRKTMKGFLGMRASRRSSSCALQEQSRMISRLALYPLMPLITIVPYFIAICLHPHLDMYSSPSQAIQWFSASTQGVLNFIFFLIDPSLPGVCQELSSLLIPNFAKKESKLGSTIPPRDQVPSEFEMVVHSYPILDHHQRNLL